MLRKIFSRTLTLVAVFIYLASTHSLPSVRAQGGSQVESDPAKLNNNFERYHTRDRFNRKITFHLSLKGRSQVKPPLVVFIQGAGCGSLLMKCGDHICGGYQILLLQSATGRARVMVAEKPGVNYLDEHQGGGAAGCAREFLEEHTLERWAEAVGAAIKAAHTLREIDPTKALVVGHSEGGIVAARVVPENPSTTHVASLSGGGPTQLFDFLEFSRMQSGPQDRVRGDWHRHGRSPSI